MTELFCQTGVLSGGQHVLSVRAEHLAGKGVLGNAVRLHLVYDDSAEGAPRTLIAKYAPADSESRSAMHAIGIFRTEVGFYREFAGTSDLRTPHCYFQDLDDGTGEFLLLLEDLAPARNGNWGTGCSSAQAQLAIRALAALHAEWWENPRLRSMQWLVPEYVGNWADMVQESWPPFRERAGMHLSPETMAIAERLVQQIDKVDRCLKESPQTLIHDDFHLDNLFFGAKPGEIPIAVVDWQFAKVGTGMLDVAFFIGGNLTGHERRGCETKLLHIYHSELQRRSVVGYTFEQVLLDYGLGLLYSLSRFIISVGEGYEPDVRMPLLCGCIIPRFSLAILDAQADELLFPLST